MKYHIIKTKIDKVMKSCTNKNQMDFGIRWGNILINRFLVGYDKDIMCWYLAHWDIKPLPPKPYL